jgi:hypothetical protein
VRRLPPTAQTRRARKMSSRAAPQFVVPKPHPLEHAPIDENLCHDISAFILTLVRGGYSVAAIQEVVRVVCTLVPPSLGIGAIGTDRNFEEPTHLLTLWHSKPPYVLRGKPRPLPLRGPCPSLETLVREVNPKLDLQSVVTFLRRSHHLRRVGRRFLPRSDVLSHRGSPNQPTHHLNTLAGVFANTDHNATPINLYRSWYDFVAECFHYPVSQMPALEEYIWKQANNFLRSLDAYMDRRERARTPGEPTTQIGAGVYEYRYPNNEQSKELQRLLRQVLASFRVSPGEATDTHSRNSASPRHRDLSASSRPRRERPS